MSKVNIVDSMMGTGKSTAIINLIKSYPKRKYFIIVNLNTEKDRMLEQCVDKYGNHILINVDSECEAIGNTIGDKTRSLLNDNKSIVTTHANLINIAGRLKDIDLSSYTFISDEEFSFIERLPYTPFEADIISHYFKDEMIQDNNGLIHFFDRQGFFSNEKKQNVFPVINVIKTLADEKRLYLHHDDKDSYYVKTIPGDFFNQFKEAYVMTFNFEGGLMDAFFKRHRIEYNKLSVDDNYNLIEYNGISKEDLEKIKGLIHIYDNGKDSKQFNDYDFSKNSYNKSIDEISQKGGDRKNTSSKNVLNFISKNMRSFTRSGRNGFFRNAFNQLDDSDKRNLAKDLKVSEDNLFKELVAIGIFKDFQRSTKQINNITCEVFPVKGLLPFFYNCNNEKTESKAKNTASKFFISVGAKGTNNYRHKRFLAYVANNFLDPFYKRYFSNHKVSIDEDSIALNMLIQWIWRSAIRDNKEIWLWLPSPRMHKLLNDFLDGVIVSNNLIESNMLTDREQAEDIRETA